MQLPKSEAEFDQILGFCLGQNKWCEYIEGDLSFLCVIAGFNAEEVIRNGVVKRERKLAALNRELRQEAREKRMQDVNAQAVGN